MLHCRRAIRLATALLIGRPARDGTGGTGSRRGAMEPDDLRAARRHLEDAVRERPD